MKKFWATIVVTLLSGILLFALVGCADDISSITDIERYADMQRQADKIDVDFNNGTREGFRFSVRDENDIEEIMEIILSDTLLDLGKQLQPPGFNTGITIYQGEKSYAMNVSFFPVNGKLYSFSTTKLKDKITELAIAQGALDIEVGVIYKVINLQDIGNLNDEKIAVGDKTALLEYLETNFGDCKYLYVYDSENLAEPYSSADLSENESGEYHYTDTVMMGKGKLLLMYHIYQNYNAVSYYITSPSMGEYVDNGNTMSMHFTFGLWHTYNLKISVIS